MELRDWEERDLAQMKAWLAKPHVKQWFHSPEGWITELELRKTKYRFIRHFIAEEDGYAVGFCQYYDYAKGGESWHGDLPASGSFSIDYLIGETEFLGRGNGTKTVRLLTERIAAETAAERVLIQPEKDNTRSRSTLLSAGYRYDPKNDVFIYPIDRDEGAK